MSDFSDPATYRMPRAYQHGIIDDRGNFGVFCTGKDCPVCAASKQERLFAKEWRELLGDPEP